MAKKQTDLPAKPLEEMLAEANAQALIDPNACVTCGHNPSHSPVLKLTPQDIDKLENMTREELLVLVKRMACQCGLVAIMTPEEIDQAHMDRLASDGIQSKDARHALGAIRERFDRRIGRPMQTVHQTVSLSVASMLDDALRRRRLGNQVILDDSKHRQTHNTTNGMLVGGFIDHQPIDK